ncbi:MAG: CARDB domain-containing protein [Steroidobacteraceae bacterium]
MAHVKTPLRALIAVICAMPWMASVPQTVRPVQAVAGADIRVVGVDFAYYERGRQGWASSRGPAIGGMLAIRCTYEMTAGSAGAAAKPWSIGFLDGEKVLERMVGTGLLDPATRRTTRTWYGRILQPGAAQAACVADIDNELAETNEANNRMARTLNVPGPERSTAPPSATRAEPQQRFAIVTPRDAAQARGAAPPFDLKFVEAAGVKRASDPRALRAIPSVSSVSVGEPLAVNCSYRIHMDAPNGEKVTVPPWKLSIERNGQAVSSTAGNTELVSMRGASSPANVFERWTPTQAGSYTFRCRLDVDGAIAETDENNNAAEFAIQVGAATATARPTRPERPASPALPARGQPLLTFAATKPGSLALVLGPTKTTIYSGMLKLRLKWQSPQAAAFDWRWQVSLWPFPGDPALPPPALLREGSVAKNVDSVFSIDLGSFPPLGQQAKSGKTGSPASATMPKLPAAPAKPGSRVGIGKPPAVGTTKPGTAKGPQGKPGIIDAPMDFHIRILPIKGGKPAGAPSNVVVAHYLPGPDPAVEAANAAITAHSEKAKKLAQMEAEAKVFKLDVLSLSQPSFPSRWGCIVVIKNPHAKTFGHPLFQYKEGEEYCPKKDPKLHEKDFGEKVLEGLEGYAHAWNGISWFYEKAKDTVASLIAEVLVPCQLLKELDEGAVSTCQEIAKEVAGTAITVGLMAAGVPPTIPDLEGMSNLAKGKAAEAAADYTCELLESEGGQCTPEMRKGLVESYKKGIDQLQKDLLKQAQEPNCGDAQEAGEHGLLPLPCFNSFPGTEVKPAPGTFETSPAVKLRVTRIRPDPDFPMDCSISAGLTVKNDIPSYGKTEAQLWPPAKGAVPALPAVGSSKIITLNFGPRQPWHPIGKQGATAKWYELLSGGTGSLGVSTYTATAVAPGPQGNQAVSCSVGLLKTVQVPKAFADPNQPWIVK